MHIEVLVLFCEDKSVFRRLFGSTSHKSSASWNPLVHSHFVWLCIFFFSFYLYSLKLGAESKWSTWTWHHRGLPCATKDSNIPGTLFGDIHQGYQ